MADVCAMDMNTKRHLKVNQAVNKTFSKQPKTPGVLGKASHKHGHLAGKI